MISHCCIESSLALHGNSAAGMERFRLKFWRCAMLAASAAFGNSGTAFLGRMIHGVVDLEYLWKLEKVAPGGKEMACEDHTTFT